MNDSARPVLTRRRFIRNAAFCALGLSVLLVGIGWLADSRNTIIGGVAALIVGVVWLVCWPFTVDEPVRPEAHRFVREFIPAMIAYTGIVVCVGIFIGSLDNIALKWLLALAPALPITWVVRAMLRHLLASDELEQRIQLQAIAIAAATVGLGSMVAGFLVVTGLVPGNGLLLWVLPALFAVYGLANWRIRRRYAGE